MGLCQVAGQTHSRRGKVPVGQGANHTRQSVLPILGFSPNPSPRSGEGHLTKASRCHTGKVSKYTPGGATRQEPLGSPAPSARSHQAQAPQLSAPFSVHGWEKGAGAEAGVPGPGDAVERNKQALVTDKTPQLPEWSPPAQGPQLSGCGDLAPSPFSFTWYQEVPGQPGV